MTESANLDPPATGHIVEIEQEILGALLMSGTFGPAMGLIRPEFFVEWLHRRIFELMQVGHERYASVNPAIIHGLFTEDERDKVKQALGIPLSTYLARLASSTVHGIAGFRQSVPNLISQYARITLGEEATRISAAAADPGSDPAELIKAATRAFDEISVQLRGATRGKTRHSLSEATDAALEHVETAISSGTGITGITWGLSDLNRATGGLHRGEMVIVGGRPGMAKTAFALSVAIKAAKAGFGVAFVSLEMNAKTLAMRALTDLAFDWQINIPYSDLITGQLSRQDFHNLEAASKERAELPLWIEEESGLSVPGIAVKLDRMKDIAAQQGRAIDLLVIDYLQLVAPSGRYQGNKVAEVSEVSFALRNLARDNGIALMALSQLSRGVESREDKRPMLSDLRDSGAIEQDADTVMFLFREAYYLGREKGKDGDAEMERLERLEEVQNKLECIIAKQRNGAVKTVDLFIDVACSAVRNASIRDF